MMPVTVGILAGLRVMRWPRAILVSRKTLAILMDESKSRRPTDDCTDLTICGTRIGLFRMDDTDEDAVDLRDLDGVLLMRIKVEWRPRVRS
jgi:hypothetical protein